MINEVIRFIRCMSELSLHRESSQTQYMENFKE